LGIAKGVKGFEGVLMSPINLKGKVF